MAKNAKREEIIKNYYVNDDEDIRFTKSKGTKLEFITTMKYIQKYAKKGFKILELGAATGAYSIPLAQQGYSVTAVELIQENLDVLIKKAKGISNLVAMQGDAVNLSRFADNSFDMVLVFGPMYHLFKTKEKLSAVNEAIRVCKPNGILMFAFLSHSATVWSYGVKKHHLLDLLPLLGKDGKIKDEPDEIFTSYFKEDFLKLFNNTNTQALKFVAADGLAYGIARQFVDLLNEKEYEAFVNWHLSTCERDDHQGISSHMLYICKKTK